MKKCLLLSVAIAFVIALIPVYIYAEIDQRDFDGDGDIDGDDLSVFAEKFGSVIWYKDYDGDKYSDGSTEYSISRPANHFLESELTAITGDCDDEEEDVNPGMDEICDDGHDNNCDGYTDLVDPNCATFPAPGEITINEMMINPYFLADSEGEYIELLNSTDKYLRLSGCYIISLYTGYSHLIDDSVIVTIAPNDFAVIANTSYALGGSILPTYVYPGLTLNNIGDMITIECDNIIVTLFDYGPYAAKIQMGASLQYDQSSDTWCSSTVPYGTGDLGTPGAQNTLCP